MRRARTVLTVVFAGAATASAVTYDEVVALVARAEAGDRAARDEGLKILKEDPSAPLAEAARGRLLVLRAEDAKFVMLYFLDLQRGVLALYRYVAARPDDPLPRVWRAASAVETNYVLWSAANTRADLKAAAAAYAADGREPDESIRCKLLMGYVAKDGGDLKTALGFWREAFAADPTGPVGAEAAKLLALFTG